MRAAFETVTALGILIMGLLVFKSWNSLPATVPIHFALDGTPNGWGSPHTFILFPLIAIAVWFLLTVIARFPGTFNYPINTTAEDRARLVPFTIIFLSWLKLQIVWMFVVTTWMTIHLTHGGSAIAITVLAFANIAAVLGSMLFYMVRVRRLTQ